jgi:hypothetical protein
MHNTECIAFSRVYLPARGDPVEAVLASESKDRLPFR